MSTNGQNEARKIRASLKHPIIGRRRPLAEFAPHMREEFRRIGGDAAVEALANGERPHPNSLNMSVAERRRRRIGQEAFWFLPTKNTLDRATRDDAAPALRAPGRDRARLLRDLSDRRARLTNRLPPDKLRRALCRAYNVFTMDQFRQYGDRIIPAAIIPMYTPERRAKSSSLRRSSSATRSS